MIRAITALVFAAAALAQVTVEQAAKSPYDLARYVNSLTYSDWEPLWRAMGNTDDPPEDLPACPPCSAELITVPQASQVIAILQAGFFRVDHYFRFVQENGDWKLRGHYSGEHSYPRRNETFRFGGKPFLKVAENGVRGSDLYLELEHWFDLTQPDFQPVFAFPARGSQGRNAFGISREVSATASEIGTGIGEAISLRLTVKFSFYGHDLGERMFRATYERSPRQARFTLTSARAFPDSIIPNQEFEALANAIDGPRNEQMLVYALPGLEKLASGKDAEVKMWLKEMLDHCKDTPEKRTLLELLAKP